MNSVEIESTWLRENSSSQVHKLLQHKESNNPPSPLHLIEIHNTFQQEYSG